MSVSSQMKYFFTQTFSGYSSIMQEPDADWYLIAKQMVLDFRVFNAEVCNLPSDDEDVKVASPNNSIHSESYSEDMMIITVNDNMS